MQKTDWTKVEPSFLKAGTTSASLNSLGNFRSLSTSSFKTVCTNVAEISEIPFRYFLEILPNVTLFL